MPTQTPSSAPWQDLEKQAYHAWREWPIWLALRERELSRRGASGRAENRTAGTAPAAERLQRTKQEGLTS
jgi:hypothetical protein